MYHHQAPCFVEASFSYWRRLTPGIPPDGTWICGDCCDRCWFCWVEWGWADDLPIPSGLLPALRWRDWQGKKGSHIPTMSGFIVGSGLGELWLVVLVLLVLPEPPTGVLLPLEEDVVVEGVCLGVDWVPPEAEMKQHVDFQCQYGKKMLFSDQLWILHAGN